MARECQVRVRAEVHESELVRRYARGGGMYKHHTDPDTLQSWHLTKPLRVQLVPFCSGIPGVWLPLPSFIPEMGWLARGRSPKTERGAIRAGEPNGLWGQAHIQ